MTEPDPLDGPDPLDVVRNGRPRRIVPMPVLIVAVGLAAGLAVFFAISLLGGFADTDDTLSKAGLAGCGRNNVLREEVNRQAEAFIHHNEATLTWAIKTRPVLRGIDTPAGRRAYLATGDLIRAYRDVRDQYFKLPIVNCEQRATATPDLPHERVRPDAPNP